MASGVQQGITINAIGGATAPSAAGVVDVTGNAINVTGPTNIAGTAVATGGVWAGGGLGGFDLLGNMTAAGGVTSIGGVLTARTLTDGAGGSLTGGALTSLTAVLSGAANTAATLDVAVGAVVSGGATATNGAAIWSGAGTGNRMLLSGTQASLEYSAGGDGIVATSGQTITRGGTTRLLLDDGIADFGDGGSDVMATGVANGVLPNDAVNLSQLNGPRERLSSGIAGVVALAAIPCPVPGRNYSAGLGFDNFNGESALAVGVKASLSEHNASLAVGAAFSDDTTVNAGVSFSLWLPAR